jgi:hypothetical protein
MKLKGKIAIAFSSPGKKTVALLPHIWYEEDLLVVAC